MKLRSACRLPVGLLLAAVVAAGCASSEEPETDATAGDEVASPDDTSTATEETATQPPSDATEGATEDSTDAATQGAGTGEVAFVQELADRLPEEIAEAGSMSWVGIPNPPTRIVGEDGTTGVEADLADAFSTILDIEVELVEAGGLSDILLALESGRADFFAGPLKSTEERQESFDFTVWLQTEASYIFQSDLEDAPASADELCGMNIAIVGAGVLNDFTNQLSDDCTSAGDEPIEVLEFADREGAILAVDSGRADAHGTTLTTALYYQSESPESYEIVSAPIGDAPDPLGAVTSNSRPELGELVFDVFEEIYATGVYDEIVEKWNLGEAAVPEPRFNHAID